MTTAGYLISRAAEHPPILALTTTIVAVRFFGLARPLARYLERLASHDLALRALGRVRSRFYERIEPLAPAELESYRRGDLLTRMVRDVDELQGMFVRGVGPPVVALAVGAVCVGVAAAVLPLAALVLGVGLLLGGVCVPLIALWVDRAAARRAATRASLTAELVEVLRGAPELVAYGREEETLAAIRASDRELERARRRDALAGGLADALAVAVAGLTTVGVLAVAVSAHDAGRSIACSSRRSRCWRCRRSRRSRRCPRPRASSQLPSRRVGGCSSSPIGRRRSRIRRSPQCSTRVAE